MIPKIYVACLASYNNGFHHGDWIHLDEHTSKDDVFNEIKKILTKAKKELLKRGIVEECEEWAIHDYEDFGEFKIKEYHDIYEICEMAEFILTERSSDAIDGVAGLMDYLGVKFEEAQEYHKDNFRGIFDNLTDMVELDVDDGIYGEIPESIKGYIDYEKIARDAEVGGDYIITLPNRKVAVYHNV